MKIIKAVITTKVNPFNVDEVDSTQFVRSQTTGNLNYFGVLFKQIKLLPVVIFRLLNTSRSYMNVVAVTSTIIHVGINISESKRTV